jgi:xanthine dehydrogenase/oxidase
MINFRFIVVMIVKSHRGPGWVQAVFTAEHIIEHVAEFLGVSPDKIRVRSSTNDRMYVLTKKMKSIQEQNFYKTGDTTPGGHTFKAFNIPALWSKIQQDADYANRLAQVQEYNSQNRWTKKGIAMIPMRFGVGWGGNRVTNKQTSKI